MRRLAPSQHFCGPQDMEGDRHWTRVECRACGRVWQEDMAGVFFVSPRVYGPWATYGNRLVNIESGELVDDLLDHPPLDWEEEEVFPQRTSEGPQAGTQGPSEGSSLSEPGRAHAT